MRAHWRGIVSGLISLVLLLLLTACGGGGGGGGDGGGGGLPPLVYSGNTSPAVITAANASRLTADVFGSSDTAAVVARFSAEGSDAAKDQGSGLTHLARRVSRDFRDVVARAKRAGSAQQAVTAAIQVDDTEPCDFGNGSVRTFGTLADNGTGTLTINFMNCLTVGITLNGQATVRVDAFDLSFLEPTDLTISFARLTLRGIGFSIDSGGSMRAQLSIGTNTETITANLVSLDNNAAQMSKTENLVLVSVYDNISFPTSYTATMSGRVFDQAHGFVDVTTSAGTQLVFGTIDQLFPDSGQALLTGAPIATGNGSILVTALSSIMVRLALNLDGNAGIDTTAILKWTELSGPVGADLADSDGDRMHNSWETAKLLNPNLNDTALDNDVDGFSNLKEYRAGTDPSDFNSIPQTPVWTSTSTGAVPDARRLHSAVWTGWEMIVWGGDDGNSIAKNTGGRFDLLANTWTPTTTVGAPSARFNHTAIWTGTEMIVWGGLSGASAFQTLGDGARYNPQTDTWTPMSAVNAPSSRLNHTAVWSGMEMIVWGGFSCIACSSAELGTGARYNPATDTWTPITSTNAPSARGNHSAVWTGSTMIVWGGENGAGLLGTGGIFDPATNSWVATNASGAPVPTRCHAAAWTGSEMILFGGQTDQSLACATSSTNTGARFDPNSNSWSAMGAAPVSFTTSNAPIVWTGGTLITWAGSGARYNPVTNTWSGLSTSGAPSPRRMHSLVWTESSVVVWGGEFAGVFNTGGIYDPSVDQTP